MSGYARCPACQGRGQVPLYVNEWGKTETADCSLCRGIGEVRADVAFEYLEEVGS